jgi:hypothetical protein
MKSDNLSQRIIPAAVLFILATAIAELFSGSTPVSRGEQLLLESLMYGPAALLIREIARRAGLGWYSVILLGLAYGLIEEALVLQSVFNPNFLNLDISYGSHRGVNWPWAEIIVTNHAFWSITLPIAVTEAFFPGKRDSSWLSVPWIAVLAVILIAICIFMRSIFYKMFGFSATYIHLTPSAFIIAFLVFLAFKIKGKRVFPYHFMPPAPLWAGIISLFFSFAWLNLLSIIFIKNTWWPVWLMETTGGLIAGIFLFIVSAWSESNWTNNHRNALALGAVFAGMIFGMTILVKQGNALDYSFQGIFITLAVSVVIIYRKMIFGVRKNLE